jgi:hypothetical protein
LFCSARLSVSISDGFVGVAGTDGADPTDDAVCALKPTAGSASYVRALAGECVSPGVGSESCLEFGVAVTSCAPSCARLGMLRSRSIAIPAGSRSMSTNADAPHRPSTVSFCGSHVVALPAPSGLALVPASVEVVGVEYADRPRKLSLSAANAYFRSQVLAANPSLVDQIHSP